MKVLVDGKEIEFENDVKIIYEEGDFVFEHRGKEREDFELHVGANSEGLVADVVNPKARLHPVVASAYWMIESLVEACH